MEIFELLLWYLVEKVPLLDNLLANHFISLLFFAVNLVEGQKLDLDSDHMPSPLTVQSPVEAFFTNSPLKSLVGSPQLRSKQNQVSFLYSITL